MTVLGDAAAVNLTRCRTHPTLAFGFACPLVRTHPTLAFGFACLLVRTHPTLAFGFACPLVPQLPHPHPQQPHT